MILAILYGAYTPKPTRHALFKDLLAMLNENLEEKELRVCAYAGSKRRVAGSFFPELSEAMEQIREIYGTERFSLKMLPPTPYHAFVDYVFTYPELLGKEVGLNELFNRLSVHGQKTEKHFTQGKLSHPGGSRS
ncbi:MAG: hypothetical protein A2942_01115 [Candidatus Lloydbacteria bacterium RIFCSPLOWO2_01_FULL_50_20]|uniref:Uncharacterized protein n=1 Tax=Candidatus Lloydbacteria bacterium RIFCSPLOWO2_01_FULL_50_20 TaxID=1798665 RepID=A0A1G2DIJ7_9BACT|nr:MAG: hypothetical protein A3C13_00090 [Candidatus Lloydbacteria bacterium RIFCSPHIGHO2_02_FULL_50_11]OGZ13429.1 MAG: hypothetical protein A2942_01115 [Candidatus Lloydbacteria bacterium RIFCSPLOWO2_01_FULL_50_20]